MSQPYEIIISMNTQLTLFINKEFNKKELGDNTESSKTTESFNSSAKNVVKTIGNKVSNRKSRGDKTRAYYYRGYNYKKLSKVGLSEIEKMKKILLEKKAS